MLLPWNDNQGSTVSSFNDCNQTTVAKSTPPLFFKSWYKNVLEETHRYRKHIVCHPSYNTRVIESQYRFIFKIKYTIEIELLCCFPSFQRCHIYVYFFLWTIMVYQRSKQPSEDLTSKAIHYLPHLSSLYTRGVQTRQERSWKKQEIEEFHASQQETSLQRKDLN